MQKKRALAHLKCSQQNVSSNHIYLIYMYGQDLALNKANDNDKVSCFVV